MNRRIVRGFARGDLTCVAFDGRDELKIAFQNEYLYRLARWQSGRDGARFDLYRHCRNR